MLERQCMALLRLLCTGASKNYLLKNILDLNKICY